MIFFAVPSVGQAKPEAIFGSDKEDHYGFIQTQFGLENNAQRISADCNKYYSKDRNVQYWGRIITLINFLAIKRVNEQNKIIPIQTLNFISQEFDKVNTLPSKILFDYLLCNWQFPHPILTINRNQRNFPTIKPYSLILKILLFLSRDTIKSAFLTKDEFYWLGKQHQNGNLNETSLNDCEKLSQRILNLRNNDGWNEFENIANSNVHLSYPLGFLRQSSLLTSNADQFQIPDNRDLFIGLNPLKFSEATIKSLIEYCDNKSFNFDRNISARDQKLNSDFSDYLYNKDEINNWIKETSLYDDLDIFSLISDLEEFDDSDYKAYKMKQMLKRLGSLDVETTNKRRVEQQYLRQYIIDGDFGSCAICGRKYSSNLLKCAHIKKRSTCTDNEKRDPYIVMPACDLGCDRLYEEGYIVIKNGKVFDNSENFRSTEASNNYIKKINHKHCSYWNSNSEKYFKDHEKNWL